jgi:hypothetical protein
VTVLLGAGIPFSRRYGPEVQEKRRSDFPMDMILALAEHEGPLHVYFRRPGELETSHDGSGSVFITFFSPRQPIPSKVAGNHFRFPLQGTGVFRSITAVLELLQEEFAGHDLHVHLGWPLSSWLDRMSTGVFVANLMRLPGNFPHLRFSIDYIPPTQSPEEKATSASPASSASAA